jgi:hypothetical protein
MNELRKQSKRIKTITKFILVLLLISLSLLPVNSFAHSFYITNSKDFQNSLTTAQSNGEDDTINLATGTYSTGGTTFTYTPASTENHALTIVGAGSGLTILDGGNNTQVLSINTTGLADDSNSNITIKNLTVQNGNAIGSGGGLLIRTKRANVTIENCEFSNNR